MNRTRQSTGRAKQVPAGPAFQIEAGLVQTSLEDTAHTLFAPLEYEPRYAYPLIVWLHGTEGDERQLIRIMPLVSMRNHIAVAPRGTVALVEHSGSGYAWRQTADGVQQAEQRIFDCLQIASQKLHFGPDRVFLAGFDCGGTMALRVALNHPQRFAGVLSLCGAIPTGQTPLRNLSEARRLPIFLAIGRDDNQYRPEDVCCDLRLFHAAGMSVTLRPYPCGHELAPQMLSDIDRWIIEQITSAPGSAAQGSPRRSCETD